MSSHDLQPAPHAPAPNARQAERDGVGAILLAVAAVPASLVAFVVVMIIFGSGAHWQTIAALTQTAAGGACCALGAHLAQRARTAGSRTLYNWGLAANALAITLVLMFAWLPVINDNASSPRPVIVNDTSTELLIYNGAPMNDPWVTLEPGQSTTVDNAPLSTNGCIPGSMTAQDAMGDNYGTIERLCAGDVWRISGPPQ